MIELLYWVSYGIFLIIVLYFLAIVFVLKNKSDKTCLYKAIHDESQKRIKGR